MSFYFFAVGYTIFSIIGDYFAKMWSSGGKTILIAGTLFFYFASSIIFLPMLKKSGSLSFSILLATLGMLLGGIFVGHFFFGERLSSLQYFGSGFAIIAIILLTFPTEIFSK